MFKSKNKKTVFVGLSGGVDSATSAALLQQDGYHVVGVFIRIVLPGYPCPAVEDRQDAMRVAAHLRIPFREIDLSEAYRDRVFALSLKEFAAGRTPNPDTLCNREIKFGLFFEYAMGQGADFVATGHYARITNTDGNLVPGSKNEVSKTTHNFLLKICYSRAVALRNAFLNLFLLPGPKTSRIELLTSADEDKDQTYFLWMVKEDRLARTLFPVGDKKKNEVRALAKKFRLPNAARKDSQGLCFLGDISMDDMLTRELHMVPGIVVNESGEAIGTHDGVERYTLGQRHGFFVQHDEGTDMPPLYVIGKDTTKNQLVVSKNKFPTNAATTHLVLKDTNWIGEVEGGEYLARYRYRQKLMQTTLSHIGDTFQAVLHEPQYVPLGQSLVLYKKEIGGKSLRCVGGGIIDSAKIVYVLISTHIICTYNVYFMYVEGNEFLFTYFTALRVADGWLGSDIFSTTYGLGSSSISSD